MKKYTGNSYYLIFRILFLLIPPIIIGYVIYQPNTPDKGLYGGWVLISIFLFFIIKSLMNLVSVEFNDYSLSITYLIIQKKVNVSYSNVLSWKCFDGQQGQHCNVVRFKSDGFTRTSKVKIDRVVNSDKFISFVKWLKTKNENIVFKVAPSDSKLLKPFIKEFGIDKELYKKKVEKHKNL